MHFDDAEAALLKNWIVKKLEDISDADSDVLADYVLALVKNDDPEPVARVNCVENLKDFLLDNAETFVSDLFLAISTKSYDPNRPPPKPAAPIDQPPNRPGLEQQALPNESRKRSFHDWDKEDSASTHGPIPSYQGGDRPMKQPRRGGRGHDQRGGRQPHVPMHQYGFPPPQSAMPPMPTPPPGMPPLDPNNPMAALLAMQQAMAMFPGMQNAGSPPNANGFPQPRSGQRCRDYDTKGYCAAGVSCPHEHGNEVVLPQSDQEYDPTNAGMLNITPSRVGQFNATPTGRGRGAGRGRGRGRGNHRGGGQRAEFSQVGSNRDKSITSIVVEQIPRDKYDEQSVRDFFSEFGNVQEVAMRPEQKLAIVHYDSNEAAQAAYDSPKVVFDNRFVKVYWYRPDQTQDPAKERSAGPRTKREAEDVDMQHDEQIDPVEFAQRQEEAQRKQDEARKRREDAEKQKHDVDAKLKAMEVERKKMADMLAKKAGKAISPPAESPHINGGEDNEQTKVLKAQLAKLEAEAKSLGIDPEAPTNEFSSSPMYRGRGGFRGRARGRGYFPGYRGGWAGAGGRGGAVMRLDNRPKIVAVSFDDGNYESRDESLRQFLLFNGHESATVTKQPDRDDTALVTFDQRYQGENFMAAANGPDFLPVGKAELSWYKADGKPTTAINGNHEHETKADTAENSEQIAADARDGASHDVAEDEDLDRWS